MRSLETLIRSATPEQLAFLADVARAVCADVETAYDALGAWTLMAGAGCADQAYALAPNVNARSLRYGYKGRVRGAADTFHRCTYSNEVKDSLTAHSHWGAVQSSLQGEPVPVEPTELLALDAAAKAAGVSACKVRLAVARYRNPVARVLSVLKDLQALVASGARVWSPTGLFVRLMRSGQEVVLPDRVVATREQAQEAQRAQVREQALGVGVKARYGMYVGYIREIVGTRAIFVRPDDVDPEYDVEQRVLLSNLIPVLT